MEWIILLFLIFMPFAIAVIRGNSNAGWVLIVNLFLSWTVIGWFVALFMALGGDKKVQRVIVVAALPTSKHKLNTPTLVDAHDNWYEYPLKMKGRN